MNRSKYIIIYQALYQQQLKGCLWLLFWRQEAPNNAGRGLWESSSIRWSMDILLLLLGRQKRPPKPVLKSQEGDFKLGPCPISPFFEHPSFKIRNLKETPWTKQQSNKNPQPLALCPGSQKTSTKSPPRRSLRGSFGSDAALAAAERSQSTHRATWAVELVGCWLAGCRWWIALGVFFFFFGRKKKGWKQGVCECFFKWICARLREWERWSIWEVGGWHPEGRKTEASQRRLHSSQKACFRGNHPKCLAQVAILSGVVTWHRLLLFRKGSVSTWNTYCRHEVQDQLL